MLHKIAVRVHSRYTNFMSIQNIATAVQQRRVEVGYSTTVALAEATGISSRIIQVIENCEKNSFRPDTILKIDKAIDWEPGSAKNLLETGTPPQKIRTLIQRTKNPANMNESEIAKSELIDFLANRTQDFTDVTKMYLLATIFNKTPEDYDLIPMREYQQILANVAHTYNENTTAKQCSHPDYTTQVLPSGITRAQRDDGKARGETVQETLERIRAEIRAREAILDQIPEPDPDDYGLTAKDDPWGDDEFIQRL